MKSSSEKGQNKRFWTEEEDLKLIDSLVVIHHDGRYLADGNFKGGHLKALEKLLEEKLPGCGLQGKPHIESRLKTLKTNFQTVHAMLIGPNCSGFGWDSERKMVTADKLVWDAYIKTHREAAPFRHKAFPYYEDLCVVFCKDHATGNISESLADVADEIGIRREEGLNGIEEDNINENTVDDDLPSMSYSDASHPHTNSDGSSKKKRKTTNFEGFELFKEASLAIVDEMKDSSTRLSQAINQDTETIRDHQKRLNDELRTTTSLTVRERHMATQRLSKDHDQLFMFFNVPNDEKDEWVRLFLDI